MLKIARKVDYSCIYFPYVLKKRSRINDLLLGQHIFMKLLKNITSILLVLVISTTGIPCFLAEDASHDGIVDLQDAIMQVKDFAVSADGSASFGFRFEKMLNTLSSVAGLKTLIDPDKESKSAKHQIKVVIAPDKSVNSFSIHLPPLLMSTEEYTEHLVSYQSRALDPSIPPPRFS